jgi:hypothetical protein
VRARARAYVRGGGEGPRSRCYGRTAAVRRIVQPNDNEDNYDDGFVLFSV